MHQEVQADVKVDAHQTPNGVDVVMTGAMGILLLALAFMCVVIGIKMWRDL